MRHKHADLIIAWANGAIIQVRMHPGMPWNNVYDPVWRENQEYRVKPKDKVKVYHWACDLFGEPTISQFTYSTIHEASKGCGTDKLVRLDWTMKEIEEE